MAKFKVTILKCEAKTTTIEVEADTSFDAVKLAYEPSTLAKAIWEKDYEHTFTDYSTRLVEPPQP